MAAGALLARVAQNWREYVAGSEGFLTGQGGHGGRGLGPGLFRREVTWGDEVSFCSSVGEGGWGGEGG